MNTLTKSKGDNYSLFLNMTMFKCLKKILKKELKISVILKMKFGNISSLNGSSLKLVDKFTYLEKQCLINRKRQWGVLVV